MQSTKLLIYPYNLGSKSARVLSGELATKRIRGNGSYVFKPRHLIINWGNSKQPAWGTQEAYANMLNKPQFVKNAAEKARTFQLLQAAGMADQLPMWTTQRNVAEQWLIHPIYGNRKNAVLCRTLTRANSGRGIVLASTVAELVPAPLYTRYKPKSTEYRVHVTARYGILDVQEKRKRTGAVVDDVTRYIRSHDNHWVFCRDGVNCPAVVLEAAEQAIHVLGLDFGAVDVGWHPQDGMAIYEVNTAPGIEGQTLANYTNVFRRYLQT